MSKLVLVTGANGHIGCHVVRDLLQHGYRVRALVRPNADLRGLDGVSGYETAHGDVQNADSLLKAAEGVDAIIHLAAVYKINARNADEIVKPAVEGTQHILAAAKAHGIQRVVYTSSIAAVGFSDSPEKPRGQNDWNEDAKDAYNFAKTVSEREAQKLAKEYGIHLVVICPAVVTGARDYKMTPSNALIRDLANFKAPTYPGGTNFVDVEDVARAHVLALDKGEAGGRYIIGSENVSLQQVGGIIHSITGKKPLYFPIARWWLLPIMKVLDGIAKKLGFSLPFSYEILHDFLQRWAYFDTRPAQQTFGLQAMPTAEAVKRSLQWLKSQNQLRASVSEKL
jgi:dihydroflavonol-4-reductase